MKYKEMKVWSAGENGKSKKIEFIMSLIIFVGWLVLCGLFFTQNMNDDKSIEMKLWEHILCGICMSGLTSIIGFVGYAAILLSLTAIKRNKYIILQLYEFNDFMKLNIVPNGKKVVYSDTAGFVLCDEVDERQYNDWQGLSKKDLYFFKFEEYFNKYKGEKREVFIG